MKTAAANAAAQNNRPAARAAALYEALFAETPAAPRLGEEVVRRKAYLAPHARDAAGQLAQLVAAEKLLGTVLPGRVREGPLVLKALYDEDLVEEGLIFAWFKRADAASVVGVAADAAAAVRAAVKPFVDWLEEAESSEEEDSD